SIPTNIPTSLSLVEIQRDRLTKIAEANWSKTANDGKKAVYNEELVKEIYEKELLVKDDGKVRRTVVLQRVMILEVSQYLENYLWPNFDPEKSSFEHVMSMMLMVNEKGLILVVVVVVVVGRRWDTRRHGGAGRRRLRCQRFCSWLGLGFGVRVFLKVLNWGDLTDESVVL
nr:intron-binding protein aquarius [Tanacetum cinerariifolium]